MIVQSLQGLAAFAAYFLAASALCVVYVFVYTRVTQHDEFDLITRQHNASAALALGMSLLGFALPLASAILHSVSILDCVIWGVIALAVQVLAYYVARAFHPGLNQALAGNAMASALWLGFISVTAGIISAVSMST